jgi:hypothetical protein
MVRRRGNEVGSPAQQGGDRHSGHGCWRQAHAAEQRRLLRQHEATSVNVLRVREENGEVSSGTTQLSWEVGGDSLTREREEVAPSSAISTATTSLNLTTHDNDWRRRRWGEEKRHSAATGHFITRMEDDAATGGKMAPTGGPSVILSTTDRWATPQLFSHSKITAEIELSTGKIAKW